MMFDEAYAKAASNPGQKQAVDTTEGPVLVVAGPGTGKTQLLSLRVGKILQNNPTILPSNILCLTFTDSAAANLRERLINSVGLGQDAYQVAIHTFNSFGSWIMTTYPEYFSHWREATTADELTTHRILETILGRLAGHHPLAYKNPDGGYIALERVQRLIGDSKRANLSPKELRIVLEQNGQSIERLTTILKQHWPKALRGADALTSVGDCIATLKALPNQGDIIEGIPTIDGLLINELLRAAAESDHLPNRSKSVPFTGWKNDWLELDEHGDWTLRLTKHQEKLLAVCDIYEAYETQLKRTSMVDFNDQIMVILAALAEHRDLRLNLQERFQYVMIDEYQDTNRAQLKLAEYLTDADVHEGRPNILAVGDDDQAIYRFQGADMSNIRAFQDAYHNPLIITLQENYRSTEKIITPAKYVSAQIATSLANTTSVDKRLHAHVTSKPNDSGVSVIAASDEASHYAWIAQEIKRLTESGAYGGDDIAVLARQRNQLDNLVPYLREQGIPIDYERRENVLEQPHIVNLLSIVRFVTILANDQPVDAGALLPEILSHPMWQIEPAVIWKVSQNARQSKRHWLDVIFEQPENPAFPAVSFLYQLALRTKELPLEQALDAIIGNADQAVDGAFISPFKNYYFGEQALANTPDQYLTFLSHISCLRRHLREHQTSQPSQQLHLTDLVDFVAAFTRAGLTMIDTASHRENQDAIKLMTVHKAKGMEFGTVFVIGLVDAVWNKSVRGTTGRFSYPANLTSIKPDANELEDALRLLFVAMTRAKYYLRLCYFKQAEDGRHHEIFAPLVDAGLDAETVTVPVDPNALSRQYESRWLSLHSSVPTNDKQILLADTLESYRLSATHLTHFLDVSRGGPAYFLTQNLLHFPSAPSPHAGYGSAVHASLRYAHEGVQRGSTPTITQVLTVFQSELAKQQLSDHDTARFLAQGNEALPRFLRQNLSSFTPNQKPEVNISQDGASLGAVQLRGIIDVLEIDEVSRSLVVTDYKTGGSFTGWHTIASMTEWTRIKQHHYKQQLMFYKFLLDGSSQWGKKGWQTTAGRLQFVEPNDYGKIVMLELAYEPEELEAFSKLITAVWGRITTLDFPNTDDYPPTLEGILQFEKDLLP